MLKTKELLEEFMEQITFSDEKINQFRLHEPDDLIFVMNYLKKNDYTFLADITAVDYKDCFEMVYQLCSLTENIGLTIKVKLDHDNPEIESLTILWDAADWMEREVYDLMGIKFGGHPNLTRILTWEGFEGHPLRKDYVVEKKRK